MSDSHAERTGARFAAGREVPARLWLHEAIATLKLSAPLALTQLAVIAINTTDVIMMGRLGPTYLAGGALGANLYMPLFLFGLGVLLAVAPMTAQALGARQFRAVRRTVRQGLWIAVLLGAMFGIVLWNAKPILLTLGQEEANAVGAEAYLRWALWGLIPSFWYIVLRAFVTAHARTQAVLLITLIGVAVNALGDYALMFGHFGFPRLELAGAGIATALVHSFMFLAVFAFVLRDRRFRRYAIAARLWRPDWPRFREIFRIGLPIGFTILAESALFATASLLMGLLGTNELAAHAIAVQSVAVAFMIPLGISQAVTVRVGVAAGRRDLDGIGRAGWTGLWIGMLVMTSAAALFWFAGRPVIGLYLDLGDPANGPVVALAVAYLAIGGIFQLADGAQVILAGALRGLKDTRVPMWIAFFGYWGIGFGLCAWLAFETSLRGEGVWSGLAVGLFVVAVLALLRFRQQLRRLAA